MVYDTIILGATFAAAGMARVWGDACLILEQKPLAGYEFLNALNFGTDYEKTLKTKEARALKEQFEKKGAFQGEGICLFDCAGSFYRLLEDKNVYLNMPLVSVTKSHEGYEVTAHGTSGYRTFYAKKVVDTRAHSDMVESKSLNILVTCDDEECSVLDGYDVKPWGCPGEMVVKISVPLDADYIEARKLVKRFLEDRKGHVRLVTMADYFDFAVRSDVKVKDDGICYLASAGFANPLAAFDAGAEFAGGGEK